MTVRFREQQLFTAQAACGRPSWRVGAGNCFVHWVLLPVARRQAWTSICVSIPVVLIIYYASKPSRMLMPKISLRRVLNTLSHRSVCSFCLHGPERFGAHKVSVLWFLWLLSLIVCLLSSSSCECVVNLTHNELSKNRIFVLRRKKT